MDRFIRGSLKVYGGKAEEKPIHNPSLLLSHCRPKASSHTGKTRALITTLAQNGLAILDLH